MYIWYRSALRVTWAIYMAILLVMRFPDMPVKHSKHLLMFENQAYQ